MRSPTYTSFDGYHRIASGPLRAVALIVKRAIEGGASGPVLIFDDATGRSIDIDTRGGEEDVVARLPVPKTHPDPSGTEPSGEPRGRGRPRLGVIPREVTLLPRHWEWLATQPGGASVALRKLVEAARRTQAPQDRARAAQERAYHFMSAMAGDQPGFEEAMRAFFANDRQRFTQRIASWPDDVRAHVLRLAYDDTDSSDES